MVRRVVTILVAVLLSVSGLQITAPGVSRSAASDVTTYLGDNGRSGYAAGETTLTTSSAASLTESWSVASNGRYISTQPMVANGIVYWGDYNGFEHATNAATGQQIWSRYLGSRYSGPQPECVPDYLGVVGAPAIGQVNGRTLLFVPGGGALNGDTGPLYFFALDPTTGQVVWQTQVGTEPNDTLWSSPAFYNGSIYEGVAAHGGCPAWAQGRLLKLDAGTGAIQNTFNVVPVGCLGGDVWGSPTIDQATGMVYIASAEGDTCGGREPYAQSIIRLRASDLGYVDSWQQGDPASADHDFGSTPTLFSGGGRSLVGVVSKNGSYYAFDRTNLAAGPVWTYNVANPGGASPEGGDGSVAPAAWDGTTLYVAGGTSPDGRCAGTLAALDPANGTAKWRDCLAGPIVPAVTAAPGILVVGAGSHLMVINSTNGGVVWDWRDPSGGQFWAAATIANGTLFAANSGWGEPGRLVAPGRLYAFNVPSNGSGGVAAATATSTAPPDTATATPTDTIPPTATGTSTIPPDTATSTIPPTATPTSTIPPAATATNAIPPTATASTVNINATSPSTPAPVIQAGGGGGGPIFVAGGPPPAAPAATATAITIATATAVDTATATPAPPATATTIPIPPAPVYPVLPPPTSTFVPPAPTATSTPTPFVATGKSVFVPTPEPRVIIHNAPRTVTGGRAVACDGKGNSLKKPQVGCEIVSVTWLPYTEVSYTIVYPDGSKQSITDTTDAHGNSLHAFNVKYLPPARARAREQNMVAWIAVRAESKDGTWTSLQRVRFGVRAVPAGKARKAAAPAASPRLITHNAPRAVAGGRTVACNLKSNSLRTQQAGCEVISVAWLPHAKVVYTIAYPNGSKQSFSGTTDAHGIAQQVFSVRYLPSAKAKHRQPIAVAWISVTAERKNRTWTPLHKIRLVVIR